MKRILVRAAALALLGLALAGCTGKPPAEGFSPGQKAPAFTLRDLDGRSVSLADYHGKVVIVDFWATWCAPCRMELPDLVRLHQSYHDKGFELLGLSVDEEGPAAVKQFAHANGMTYPILMASDYVQGRYGVRGYPTTFVIDRAGVIRNVYVGVQEGQVLEAALKAVLAS